MCFWQKRQFTKPAAAEGLRPTLVLMQTVGLVLAAGMSRRMGRFKPLLPLEGKPLIAHSLDMFFRAGITDVRIVTGFKAEEIRSALSDQPVRWLHNPDYETTEMFDSARIAIRDVLTDPAVDAAFLLPGDMPAIPSGILPELIRKMEETDADLVFPSRSMKRLHPPLLSRACLEQLAAYDGQDGLRGGFKACAGKTEYVLTDDAGCGIDVDTPDDYDNLLKLKSNC